MSTESSPLSGPPPAEVPLPRAPLVRVLAQVRFSPVLSVRTAEFIAPFQEAIRGTYGVLREETGQLLTLGQDGGAPISRQTTTWRFRDMADEWRVSISDDFVALESKRYTSRREFLERLKFVVEAVQTHVQPGLMQRLGLRYIDRIEVTADTEIEKFVRQEMLGVMATPLSVHVQHSVSETLLHLPEMQEQLRIRCGHLPAGGTLAGNVLEPIDKPSWVLDLDMFSTDALAFDADAIMVSATCYAERIYTVFRWVVTPDFLRYYGGEP